MADVKFNLIGVSIGPFLLYSNVDGFSVPFASGITVAQLLANFPTAMIPLGTTTVRVRPTDRTMEFLDMSLIPITTTTTTTL